jgi:predicted transcriptional regulator
MPRGSRSSRKQPDFDPSELDDLIFSPAVGTGVGSHLMERTHPFPAPTSGLSPLDDAPDSTRSASATPTVVAISNKSTVDKTTTVDTLTATTVHCTDASTVEDRDGIAAKPADSSSYRPALPSNIPDVPTVAKLEVSTVVVSDMPTVIQTRQATVAISKSTTVDTSSDVRESPKEESTLAGDTTLASTVEDIDMSTVATFNPSHSRKTPLPLPTPSVETETPSLTTVDDTVPTTVDTLDTATVVTSDRFDEVHAETVAESARSRSARIALSHSSLTTVDMSDGEIDVGREFSRRSPLNLWVTDDGDLVSQSRVRRIRIAQDVVNSAEEAVYDTLWNTKTAQGTAASGDSARIVQAGYDYLGKRTRLSKKTIQRVIDRLIHKDFIAIEKPADIYRRIPTVYRVFDYRTILAHHVRKSRTHVAKIGPGFTYAHPIDDPRRISINAPNMTTVATIDRTTVDPDHLSTEAPTIPVTGDKENQTTVVQATTRSIDKNLLGKTSSASRAGTSSETTTTTAPPELISGLQKIVEFVDTEAATLLWNECRLRVPDCRPDEVLYFAQGKASVCAGGRIKNPVGFLLTTVPKCFEGPAFANFRREEERKAEEERRRQHNESVRLRQIQEQGREEADALELGKRRLDAMSPSEYQAMYEKTKSAFLERYPNALRSAPKTIEDLVQQEMIRGLQN